MMCWNRIGLFTSACLLFVTFSACEDPGRVGEDLVGGLDGSPEAEVVLASTFSSDTVRDVTGNATRVMVGRVVDPLLGTMSATGYIDFGAGTGATNDFREGPATAAELHLVPDYTYGSTIDPVTLRLSDVLEELTTAGARSDTTISPDVVGDFIMEFTVNPSDTLVVIPLPEAWIAANSDSLTSTDFARNFHGFQISSASGNTIKGFNGPENRLLVVSGGDSVFYPVNKQLTTLARESEPSLPEGYQLLQDGFGRSVLLDFPFEDSLTSPTAINRVVFALTADTLAVQGNAPAGFTRPLLRELTLYALEKDSTTTRLSLTGSLDYRLNEGKFLIAHPSVISIIQLRLRGDESFAGFRLAPDVESNTINPILIYTGDLASTPDENETPKAAVTLTPTE